MSVPVWVLLGFAGWTILLLISTIGIYRWSSVLSRKADLIDFPADIPHGQGWYRRAMRAHANCIENLPIYTAIVIGLTVTNIQSSLLNILAISILIARILQSLTHVLLEPTNTTVAVRFFFFAIQLFAMIWMGLYLCFAIL